MSVAEPLRAVLGAARGRLRAARLYAGRTLVVRPLPELDAAVADGRRAAGARSDGEPRFDLVAPRLWPLPPGRYLLTLEVSTRDEPVAPPQLYVDSGLSYSESERAELHFRELPRRVPRKVPRKARLMTPGGAWARRLVATVALPLGALGLRFAPGTAAGTPLVDHVRIRRVSRLQRYGGLIAGRAFHHLTHPISGARAAARTVKALLTGGGGKLLAGLRAMEMYQPSDYRAWIESHDRRTEREQRQLRRRLAALDDPPLIAVVMPVHDTPERLLRAAIDSVREQIYELWELCIADDASTAPHVRRVLEEAAHSDRRIEVVFRDEHGHIARATNSAFERVTGAWTACLDHDDVLPPHALAEVALEIAHHPEAELIYTDEDKIDADGRRDSPFFKPDFSRELLRSQNYLNHLTVHRTENIRAVGGWRPGFEGSQDYDLNLRVLERIDMTRIRHIPKVLYHWRAVPGSAALSGDEKGYAYAAGLRALTEHVTRLGLAATVEAAPEAPVYRVRPALPAPPPRVSLVIPTRDGVDHLRRCVVSIRDMTTYASYEILIVDNGSVEEETLHYLGELERCADVRVLPYDGAFNYSAINNYAVARAQGSVVALVNNDIEVISPDWLTEMVAWAVRPDVGCVGAKLYYANDTIQHAGVILGLGGVAGHSHKYFPRDHDGYLHRLKVIQNLSAVTAACLVVRKEVYDAVGGFNERDLPVAFNDVDFCIRVREAGYQNVWTPYAELYHLESTSRGPEDTLEKRRRAESERNYMLRKWRSLLRNDPYYSPHLTRTEENFSLAT